MTRVARAAGSADPPPVDAATTGGSAPVAVAGLTRVLDVVGPTVAVLRRRVARVPTALVALGALVLFAAATWYGVGGRAFRTWDFRDLDVYRAGAEALLRRAPLYSAHPPHSDLLFTYPPFAALVFVPLELGPVELARLAVTACSLAAAVVIAHAGLRGAGRPTGWRTGWWSVALAAVALRSQPFSQTLHLGQVDLVVIAMVLADLLLVSAPRRGWLLGVAAGFKPTPLVLVGYLVLSRQWRAAAQAVLGFAATVGVGYLVLPGTSRRYWGTELLDTARVGSLSYVANQSLAAMWARATHDPHPGSRPTVTLGVLALVVGTAAVLGWLYRRTGAQAGPAVTDQAATGAGPGAAEPGRVLSFEALCLAGVAGLLASPVSWTHHWVWCLPITVALVARWAGARTDRAFWGWGSAALVWVAVFWSGPMWHTPRGRDLEFTDSWWQAVAADSYALLGVGLLAAALAYRAWPAAERLRRSAEARAGAVGVAGSGSGPRLGAGPASNAPARADGGDTMASMVDKLMSYARSPKGQQLVEKARAAAEKPENQRKIMALRDKLMRKV